MRTTTLETRLESVEKELLDIERGVNDLSTKLRGLNSQVKSISIKSSQYEQTLGRFPEQLDNIESQERTIISALCRIKHTVAVVERLIRKLGPCDPLYQCRCCKPNTNTSNPNS